jgi:hypothetical protein
VGDERIEPAVTYLYGLVDERVGLRGLFGNGDFANAAVLIRGSFESKAAARTGFDIVLEVGAMHRQGGGG